MTYQEIVDWLFKQIPNYQKQGGQAYKPGLDTIKELLNITGNPHDRIKTIHIAGTNGKGSVAHVLTAIFQSNDYKVGLFTSPHINDFRERIKINGAPVGEENVVRFFEKYQNQFKELKPSFFEITTALAFHIFEEEKCDICIIETGLGGRLDSTNVILPVLSIITNIAMDHMAFLGNSIGEIAKEKAGIIKDGIPLVVGDANNDAIEVFESISNQRNSKIYFSADESEKIYNTDLIGSYQQRNINTAMCAVKVLDKQGWNLKAKNNLIALKSIAYLTGFQGRLQEVSKVPRIIVDAGHNEAGIQTLFHEINQLIFSQLYIVYAAANDKDLDKIFTHFPKDTQYIFTEFNGKRSVKMTVLAENARNENLSYVCIQDAVEALNHAKSKTNLDDLIVVCGSFYLLEKII